MKLALPCDCGKNDFKVLKRARKGQAKNPVAYRKVKCKACGEEWIIQGIID